MPKPTPPLHQTPGTSLIPPIGAGWDAWIAPVVNTQEPHAPPVPITPPVSPKPESGPTGVPAGPNP